MTVPWLSAARITRRRFAATPRAILRRSSPGGLVTSGDRRDRCGQGPPAGSPVDGLRSSESDATTRKLHDDNRTRLTEAGLVSLAGWTDDPNLAQRRHSARPGPPNDPTQCRRGVTWDVGGFPGRAHEPLRRLQTVSPSRSRVTHKRWSCVLGCGVRVGEILLNR